MKASLFLRIVALLLTLCTLTSLFACTPNDSTPPDDDKSDTALDTELPIRITVLSGTTGFGMAPLMQWTQDGKATLNYQFQVEADASNVNAALIQGSVDIAALPTNAASVVYNKTAGEVQVLALNTLGVLYLLDNGNGITSIADLKGKTVAAPAQNPTFIFRYICEKNGLTVGSVGDASADVILDNSYTTPAELQANVAAGNVTLAVLPEPLVTVTKTANTDVKVVLDLTEEWNRVSPENSLVQGCIVVRRAFAEEHPAEVAAFLEEYGASVSYVTEHVEEASEMVVAQGIFAKAAVAAKAIPNCNLCFIVGEDMKASMQTFLTIMHGVAPASVGGNVPGDDFYYIVSDEHTSK